MELDILDWWDKNDILSQYLHQNDESDKTFSFIDGPITANGPMGVHHARGRTLKDVYQRYYHALGFAQRFQNGFDCKGLWVEIEVEKEAGFNSKKDISQFGLANFTQACLDRVSKYSQIQTDQSQRLGMFMDWPNSYYTNSTNNNLYIWYFLKIIHQKGWLLKQKSSTTWCPRCETGVSQHEQAEAYKNITESSVYLKFKLKNRPNEYLLAWTTTPWTLSANVLLAINPRFDYVKAKQQNHYLYLSKDAALRLRLSDYEIIDAYQLLNLEYESLYQIPAQEGVKHYVVAWDLVDPAEGTGIVHVAPGCGQEDYHLGKKLNAAILSPLDETGHFQDGYGDLTGKYAHSVAALVFDYLKSTDSLFRLEDLAHRYPHCWRCKTKCLFRLEDNWYIQSDEIRPLLKKAAATVNWHPRYIGRRMQNWLDTMEDWMISRKRFYGLALPFYPCSCGELTVVGSLVELKQLAVNPQLVDRLKSLHRPYIDEVQINCPKCQQAVNRVADVGDCWLDAGVVPFSTLNYLTDKKYWQKWFPADLVLEMTEQVRLWFYSMLFFSVTLEGLAPYCHVLAHAEVRDEKGERMSKTKKNGIPFDQAVVGMSADAIRWLYCRQTSHTNINFGYSIADGVKKDFLLILWNTLRFFIEHANSSHWQPSVAVPAAKKLLDRWILSRLNSTIAQVGRSFNQYQTPTATKAIESFVGDLSTWYIRRSRQRLDNQNLLYCLLSTTCQLLAPFVPFIAELIYQNLHPNGHSSVHLQRWPKSETKHINQTLESQIAEVRNICQELHALRQKSAIIIRQPLAAATIKSQTKLTSDLLQIIKDELNIKNIIISDSFSLDTNLTPDLIAEGQCRDLIRKIQVLRKELGLALTDKITITAPSWPKAFQADILRKTLASSITQADKITITKTN